MFWLFTPNWGWGFCFCWWVMATEWPCLMLVWNCLCSTGGHSFVLGVFFECWASSWMSGVWFPRIWQLLWGARKPFQGLNRGIPPSVFCLEKTTWVDRWRIYFIVEYFNVFQEDKAMHKSSTKWFRILLLSAGQILLRHLALYLNEYTEYILKNYHPDCCIWFT